MADTGWIEGFLERVERVASDEVQRVAQRYLQPNQRTVGWYLPDGVT